MVQVPKFNNEILAEDAERVDALCEIESGLSGNEMDFIESATARVRGGRMMSTRQRNWAEDILERCGR